jgi:hypothetical protein
VSTSGAGAAGGALWGGLIGLIFLMPFLGMAIGGAAGAAGGAATDYGIDDKFMKELGEKLPPAARPLRARPALDARQGPAADLAVRRRGRPHVAADRDRADAAGGADARAPRHRA